MRPVTAVAVTDQITATRVAERVTGLLAAEQGQPPAVAASPPGGTPESGAPPSLSSGRSVPQAALDTASGYAIAYIRRRIHRLHLVVVGLLLVLALAAAGWSLLRSRAVAVSIPLSVTSGSVVPTATTSAAAPLSPPPGDVSGGAVPSPAPQIIVHVVGGVRRPGLVRLPLTARVQDAIAAAGGLRRDGDYAQLNLARVLGDGQQIAVGTRNHPLGELRDGDNGAAAPGQTVPEPGTGPAVDLNQATPSQLDALPGVGPVTVERIVAWRTAHGRFDRVEELQEVEGIGPKTYARLAPHLRV